MYIKFYLDGDLDPRLADYVISVDGVAYPRSKVRKRDLTRIVLETAAICPTPRQREMIELIRFINREGVNSFSFKY